jgi:Zn-dependent protease
VLLLDIESDRSLFSGGLLLFSLTAPGIITRAIVLLVAVVVHEFAHAYIAFTQGDTTAYDSGRMTLDPRANMYWPGYFIGVLFGFAILGSAPVNPYRMRNPRTGMLLAVAAGPISNLILAALFAVPFRLGLLTPTYAVNPNTILPSPEFLLSTMVFLNVLLFVFNLLPLSPLDGWTVVLNALPRKQSIWWQRHQQTTMYILFGLVLLSFATAYLPFLSAINPLNWLIAVPTNILSNILIGS